MEATQLRTAPETDRLKVTIDLELWASGVNLDYVKRQIEEGISSGDFRPLQYFESRLVWTRVVFEEKGKDE